jgi:nucleolar complex protein 3
MAEKKRGAPPSKDTTKQTKRQRKAAAHSSSTKKASSSNSKQTIPNIDTPIPDLLPHQRIDLIANLSEAVLEDPTSAVSSSRTAVEHDTSTANDNEESPSAQYTKTQSKLQTLLLLASPSTNGHDGHAARLAILSLLAIYTDILPSYRIRLPTATELSVVVGKDVKKQWDYEKKLLSCYQRYLSLLEKIWEGGKYGSGIISDGGGSSPPTTLAATAILSLSQLLISCYNFNFRSNLLSIVVRNGNIRHSTEVRSACCNALRVMFERDTGGEASLEAVRMIGKMVKQQDGKKKQNKSGSGRMIHSDLLETWMALPLRVHEDEAVAGTCLYDV